MKESFGVRLKRVCTLTADWICARRSSSASRVSGDERVEEDHRLAKVLGSLDAGHRHDADAVVDVRDPRQFVRDHFAQDLIDACRARIGMV